MKTTRTLALFASLGLAATAQAHKPAVTQSDDSIMGDFDWMTGRDVEFFGLTPHLHLLAATGISSTANDKGELASGHHDPNSHLTLQAAEFGFSARWGDYLQGFFTHSYYSEISDDGDTDFHHGTEELFLKLVNLPGGFEVRGGQFLNRFGFQNATHNHAWDFANQNLVNGAILQEGELSTIGAEITWNLPTEFPMAISFYAGDAPEHEEDHGGGGPEPLFEGHEGELDEDVVGINFMAGYNVTDFHQFAATLSATHGQNHFATDTSIIGAGLQYMWRENGLEPGGRSLTLRGEVLYRTFEAVAEDPPFQREDIEQAGAYFTQIYEHNSHWSFSNRIGYVTGDDDAELTQRLRLSQAVTWYVKEDRSLFTRLQLDNDWIDGTDIHETSLWLQVGMSWGGAEEVR